MEQYEPKWQAPDFIILSLRNIKYTFTMNINICIKFQIIPCTIYRMNSFGIFQVAKWIEFFWSG